MRKDKKNPSRLAWRRDREGLTIKPKRAKRGGAVFFGT